jgi:outer membrane protein assembly factor BamB
VTGTVSAGDRVLNHVYHNQINGYVFSILDNGAAAGAERYRAINWTTRGSSTNFTSRIVSNVTYAYPELPVDRHYVDWNAGLMWVGTDVMLEHPDFSAANVTAGQLAEAGILQTPRAQTNVTGFDLYTGNILWTKLLDVAKGSGGMDVVDHGKVAMFCVKDTAGTPGKSGFFTYMDMRTGNVLGESHPNVDLPWGPFGSYSVASAYGMHFRFTYDGVYAFNWTNGDMVWHYQSPALANFESPYITANGTETYAMGGGGGSASIADGKIYVQNEEHSESWPRTRGWGMYCLDVFTGELKWKIIGDPSAECIADGYLVAPSSRDGYMYVFGKGLSKTTVTAGPNTIALSDNVLIEGTVLDQSPGQAGTPCVSAASMQLQMEYLHMQMPQDGLWHNESMTGVPVSLVAIGSDNSVIDLGTVTTNGYYGTFSKAWTPPKQDTYTIIAQFAADDSYGSSSAATSLSVGPAPEPIDIPPTKEPVDNTMLLYATLAAVIVAIVIGLVAVLLALRRH